MTATLIHRGPDGSGVFFDPNDGIGFGHRRLSIVDLSEQGRQPMWSHSGRFCITYNGEVYNAPEIRAELERRGSRIAWRGHSDTEVVLEAIEALGLDDALSLFRGMFAFGLWDAEAKRLLLVRDRVGIKPLLYLQSQFGIAFASELRALLKLPPFRARLDRSTLASFLRYGVVPGDACIVEGIGKVAPGTVVCFGGSDAPARKHVYWDAARVASEGLAHPFRGEREEGVAELERLLSESVSLRMRSDVPFGAFLSGGIDSSTVAAMMQRASSRPVKTFCIGNTTPGYDEAIHAEKVAAHLGCEHHTLMADPSDMLSVVPDIAPRWDEPFADSSQVPTYLVSRLTREHVTVSLSGDGGDELFAGYNRHAWAPRLWALGSRLPSGARRALRNLRRVGTDDWDRAFQSVGLGTLVRLPGDKLHKVAALADADAPYDFYDRLCSHWVNPTEVMLRPSNWEARVPADGIDASFSQQMMFYDLTQYLPDDILTKVDRASMAVSLEARVPLLDHRIIELAWRFPLSWKIRGRGQKWILRQVLARHVPSALFERPKTGFGVPVGQWLRDPLRAWASDLLDPKILAKDGLFDPSVVSRAWEAHQAGHGNHEHRLWAILMFQSWWGANRKDIEA